MDPLVEMSSKRWPEIRDSFDTRDPRDITGYYMMDIPLRHPELVDAFSIKVFCPYGLIENGAVLFIDKGALKEVVILAKNNNTEQLEKAIVNTKRIDWSEVLCVPWADAPVTRLMKRVCPKIGVKMIKSTATIRHVRSKDSEPFEDLEAPPGTYAAPLEVKHVDQVDRAWVFRYPTSPRFYRTLITNQLTYGLFSTHDHALLCWVTICEAGYLTHLFCEEQHRKKGYAEFLGKYVTNDQLRLGRDVFCYVVEDNLASMKLFRKLDYDVIGRGVWMYFTREDKVEENAGLV
ncbi:uncharacterized protein LOC105395288 [Plutella xylostella]|uniref:uncharacterized protein LOC105395288 n=1 Tax=Plutella xylostella TaxID=51655 RepID=UPI002032C096|nr:uncharacterized protein LOC105395288 [Plutella xylostella]